MRDMIGKILYETPVVLIGMIAVGVVALTAALFAVEGLVIWALWNALVPALAGGPSLTYVQGVLMGVVLSVVSAVLGKR